MENGYGDEYNRVKGDKAKADSEYEMEIIRQEELRRLEADLEILEGEMAFVRNKIARLKNK